MAELAVVVVAEAPVERVLEAPKVFEGMSSALAGVETTPEIARPEILYRCHFCGSNHRLLRNDFQRQRRRRWT
jgi:hypothetical protein